MSPFLHIVTHTEYIARTLSNNFVLLLKQNYFHLNKFTQSEIKISSLKDMLIQADHQKYKVLVERLYRKCQDTQTENERLVLRITNTKKILKRRTRDVEILKKRLDRYNDSWRHVPMVVPHRTRKTELKRGPKPKPKNPAEPRVRGPNKQKRMKQKQQQPPLPPPPPAQPVGTSSAAAASTTEAATPSKTTE